MTGKKRLSVHPKLLKKQLKVGLNFQVKINLFIKFISGPFTQMIFDIIEDRGGKLKVLLNNANMTISKSSKNLLYSYI